MLNTTKVSGVHSGNMFPSFQTELHINAQESHLENIILQIASSTYSIKPELYTL
jgi:hypothetical protein